MKLNGVVIATVQPVCSCETAREKREFESRERAMTRDGILRKFGMRSLPRRLAAARFSNFELLDGSETAYRHAVEFAELFRDGTTEGLMLWGEPGNGKSHLMAAVTNELLGHGYAVVFMSVPDLLARIRGTFDNGSRETEKDLIQMLLEADLLILDDVGAENITKKDDGTSWVQDVLFRIIDGRYKALKPTCYTSNLYYEDLGQRLGDRILDRILGETLIIENKAKSYRNRQARDRVAKVKGE